MYFMPTLIGSYSEVKLSIKNPCGLAVRYSTCYICNESDYVHVHCNYT